MSGRHRHGPGPPWGHRGTAQPPWWPADHPWPPGPGDRDAWRGHGRRMARRIGCVAALLLLVLGGTGTALVWLVLSTFGVVGVAPVARILSATGLFLGILAVLVSALLVRRLASPAQRLVDAAHRIEVGDYSARVPERGPAELRALARAFNAMSGRLEADEVRRRSVLADVAHELRTPLTIIRGQAEGIIDGVYSAEAAHMAPILAATRTLEGLVADLRTLALAESGSLRLERSPVDVAVLVNETLAAFASTADAAGVRLREAVDDGVPAVDGDAARLRGVLANLVSNAIRHTARGGTVDIRGHAINDGIRITVADDGEGIPTDLLPRVFDRFVKGPASSGSGLGLAIVRDVVEAHGGSVAAQSSDAGTTIHLTLPARGREG